MRVGWRKVTRVLHHIAGWRIWKHRLATVGLLLTLGVTLVAILAPLLINHDVYAHNRDSLLTPPSRQNWLGTDSFGRDIYSRIIWGTRISLAVGFGSIVLASVLGVSLGILAGFVGGWVDLATSRAIDVLMSFPVILLSVIIIALVGSGIPAVVVAIGLGLTPRFGRVIRSETLAIREREYIDAARVLGASSSRIMFRHVLPNISGSIVILASLYLPHAILTEASLSFIGIGVSPGTPSWGQLVSLGRAYLTIAPWVSVFPGLAIMLTVIGFNLLGDGLRDLLDPRHRG